MEKRPTKTERERLYKRQLSCVSGSGWGQVDENDLDHIICKVGVITRFAALNSRATVVNTLEVRQPPQYHSFLPPQRQTVCRKLKHLV